MPAIIKGLILPLEIRVPEISIGHDRNAADVVDAMSAEPWPVGGKELDDGMNVQDLGRYRNPPDLRGRSAVQVQLWWIVQALLFHTSPQFLYGWRCWLLRLFGAKIGKGVIIRPSVRVTYPWKLEIGDRAWVGDYAELYTLDRITIGEDAVVSQYSKLVTGSHDFDRPTFDMVTKPIVIEKQAWVAADCFIAPGVTVGKGAVVLARSLVTRDVPEFMVVAGQPAVVKRRRGPKVV
jgi:putative colanic acid biosynthesis acetyltransferase WcaF